MYLIYITFPNLREAKKIGRKLLKMKLVACVNIFPISSVYWWQGKIEETKEVVTIAKTLKRNYKKVEALIKRHHSYQVPCICAFEVKEVEKDYLKWLKRQL